MKVKLAKNLSVIFVCLLFLLSIPANAQPLSEAKEKPYHLWLTKIEAAPTVRGYLLHLENSFIVIRDEQPKTSYEVSVVEIDQLQFRRKGAVGKGILIGAISGAATGALLAVLEGDGKPSNNSGFTIQFSPEALALTGMVVGAVPGAVIGGIIGGSKVKIPIGGSQENYLQVRDGLLQYTLKF